MVNLTFNRVSKKYKIYADSSEEKSRSSLLNKLRSRFGNHSQEFWALRDVSFTVERGEALGIIGLNGAGKSTILKLLYNITTPSKGEIRICGKLSALIEVSSGFHPELTGRENVYLNGSLLGMRRREIRNKLDSIIDFSGVGGFIDSPVKRYSSGMYLRLGFSIAAHLDPDILLLDEVLAVGDAAFQAKCIQRIAQLRKEGTTIVFVSHNLGAVDSLCDRTLLIKEGQIYKSGATHEVIAAYEDLLLRLSPKGRAALAESSTSTAAEIVSVKVFDAQGRHTTMFATGDAMSIQVELNVHRRIEDAVVEVYFNSVFGNLHTHFSTENGAQRLDLEPGSTIVEFSCAEITLEVAAFEVEAGIRRRGLSISDFVDRKHGAVINVGRGKPVHGVFYTPHQWRVLTGDARKDMQHD
jgi:ABC-type polysaccharide/polyol phosphate transport system ATPase subunit